MDDATLLGDLIGDLDADRSREVRTALAQDPALRTRSRFLAEVLGTIRSGSIPDAPSDPVPDRLRRSLHALGPRLARGMLPQRPGIARSLARLVFDSFSVPTPAFGFRGDAGSRYLTVEAQGLEATLRIAPDDMHPGSTQLRIAGEVRGPGAPADLLLLDLGHADRSVTGRTDAQGLFAVSAHEGDYLLTIRSGDQEFVTPPIRISLGP